jgi:predicted flap endonuclease-1-like 5' DNA nuclease
MAWIADFSTPFSEERAERAWRFPIGLGSPLWAIFGAAATGAVAYWWLTRWMRPARIGTAAVVTLPITIQEPAIDQIAAQSVDKAVPIALEEAPASPGEPIAATHPAADDLTRMHGIGPKLSRALAARGVTRFAQIAAWTDIDLAELDAALDLKGRAVREAWVDQARKLAAQG